MLFIVVFLLIPPLNAGAQNQELDREKIMRTIASYSEAREASNPDSIRALFTSDADQLVSSGEWRYGLDALVNRMLQSSTNNPGKRTLTIEKIKFFTSGVAIADAKYQIIRDNEIVRNMWSSFVMINDNNYWKISAIRNMLPAK